MPLAWFRRLGDIPGLDYEPPVAVDRQSLPRHDAVPEVNRFDFDGRPQESLSWVYVEDGEELNTGASPANAVTFGGLDDDLATSTLLTRLWEGLELPGEPSDYHFAIQRVAGALWGRRRADPQGLAWAEYLYWLDIRLLRAQPDAVRDQYAGDYPGRSPFYSVKAFHTLVGLYAREGFLQEAFVVAHIAREFDQGDQSVAELEERLAQLQAEDAS